MPPTPTPPTRWRVTWTRERGKKKKKNQRKFDGYLDIDADGKRVTLYNDDDAGEDDDADGCGTRRQRSRRLETIITRGRLSDDVANALEEGCEIDLGDTYAVYLDEVVTGGGGGAGEARAETTTRASSGVGVRAGRHGYVNKAFAKKFIPPMLKTTTTATTGAAAVGSDGRAPLGRLNQRRVGVGGTVEKEAPVGAFARALLAAGGDFDAMLASVVDSDDDVNSEGDDDLVPPVMNASKVGVDLAAGRAALMRRVASGRSASAVKPEVPKRAVATTMSVDRTVAFPPHDYRGAEFKVANGFNTVREYQAYFTTAVCEQLKLRLLGISKTMHQLRLDGEQSRHGPQNPQLLQKILWSRHRIRYYTQVELNSRRFVPKNSTDRVEKTMHLIEVKDIAVNQGKKKEWTKGDLYIVSTDPMFNVLSMNEVGDRNRAPWTGLLENLWYGLDKFNKFEGRFLGPKPLRFRDNSTVGNLYAIHALNARSETEELDCIQALSEGQPHPLLDCLLGKPPPTELREEADLYLTDSETGVEALQKQFQLNEDQAQAASGALASATSASKLPIRLIHGPFGSGKTHTIAAFIIKAVECLKSTNDRIMISAHTNVAVDRALQALLNLGFEDFMRVGSLKKIDPRILPYSLHSAKTKTKQNHLKELQSMLDETSSHSARAILQAEIERFTNSKEVEIRRKLLKKCRVVGVTCSSSCNDELKNMTFDVLVLDESSQVMETSSLMPIVQSRCKTLVAVGDPKQLPPVLESTETASQAGKKSKNTTRDPLKKTLFSRMCDCGHSQTTLRTQYRLHPALSAIPNQFFYEGVLRDGVTAADREGIITISTGGRLPPITWWDTTGFDEKVGLSKLNTAEAQRVSCVVQCLMDNKVSAQDIGVISVYKAQADCVSKNLAHASDRIQQTDDEDAEQVSSPSDVQVSTVDAFQGQEKEVIILTLCGASVSSFVTDERMNVALTRAKRHLIIVGAAAPVQKSGAAYWCEILKRARKMPNGYIPASQQTNTVLQKWGPVEKQRNVRDILCSPSSEPELSQTFVRQMDVLRKLGVDQKMYWEFYCDMMRAVNYEHEASRVNVTSSVLFPLIRSMYPQLVGEDGSIAWNKSKARKVLTLDVLGLLRDYVVHEFGAEWGQLDTLIDAFEDREEFEKDPTRFGWLCLEDAKSHGVHGARTWAKSDFIPSDAEDSWANDDDGEKENDDDDDSFD